MGKIVASGAPEGATPTNSRRITMKTKQMLFALLIVTALALSACSQAATPQSTPAQDTTAAQAMDEKPADDAMMDEKPADDAMMDEKPAADAMMDEKPADDAMMDEKPADDAMMDEKPADDAMMDEKPADDAMMDEKPADDAMMDDPMVELPAWFNATLTDVNRGQPFTIAGYQGKVVLVETLAVWCSNCLKQQREVLALHEALGERDDFVSVGIDIDLNESAEQLKDHAGRNGFDWVYAIATPEVARAISDLYGVNFLNPPSTPMLIIDRHGQAHPLPFGIKSASDLQAALEPFLSEGM
jgi:cytochrome oxidase Cu insertion factor (SCO1/SenC/PrrC family)